MPTRAAEPISRLFLRPTSLLALLVFLAVSISWTVFFENKGIEAFRTSDTTDVFYSHVTNLQAQRSALAMQEATLLERIWQDQKAVWSGLPLTAWYQAQFDAYLKSVYLVSGDIVNAYKWLVAPLNFIYLVGCYLIFVQVTRQVGLSLALALLASLPIFISISGENFGMGPFINFSRRHLYTAFVPLGLFLFYRWSDKNWLLLVVFGYLGLISNLHASGVLFIEVAVTALILWRGFSTKMLAILVCCLGVGFAGAFVALGGLWSKIGTFFSGMLAAVLPFAHAAQGAPVRGIPEELTYLFYPPLMYAKLSPALVGLMTAATFVVASLPLLLRSKTSPQRYQDLLFLSSLAIFAFLAFAELKYWLIAAVVIWFYARHRILDSAFELTSYLVTAVFFVGFGLMLLSQWAYLNIADFPLVYNNLRATRFLGLFIFIWLGILLASLELKALKPFAKRLCLFLLFVAVIVDLRGVYRHHFRAHHDAAAVRSLMDVARWAKDNTPADASFFVVSSAFGTIAERRVFMSDKQRRQCSECAALTKSGTPSEILANARAKGMNYVLLTPSDAGDFKAPAVYGNHEYLLVPVN
jgi:hypothetical protein